MTKEKLKTLLEFYDHFVKDSTKIKKHETPKTNEEILEHVRYMCNKGKEYIEDGHIEKSMRWLGFIQGVFFGNKIFTIEELRNHSK